MYTPSEGVVEYASITTYMEACGNGVLEAGEECDDGNSDETDDCNNECVKLYWPVCGNLIIEDGEACDDGPTGSDLCTEECLLNLELIDRIDESILTTSGYFSAFMRNSKEIQEEQISIFQSLFQKSDQTTNMTQEFFINAVQGSYEKMYS